MKHVDKNCLCKVREIQEVADIKLSKKCFNETSMHISSCYDFCYSTEMEKEGEDGREFREKIGNVYVKEKKHLKNCC